jgi:hypothetical protein
VDPGSPELRVDENFENTLVLDDFLNHCYMKGILSKGNYEILIKRKVEGFEAKELAALGGSPSAMAIHQRMHRTTDRLRRTAPR